ncbi:hypothetical protein VTK73DRAFT_7713 [Phialemonium thermophilum]|uniref:Tse2 ADP-ribosyltransferase toxin domain-containing protein n=1 Tax=Phialemonium thermophilum TaxID=223376 RepID=A0ABR3WD54_9PEZI
MPSSQKAVPMIRAIFRAPVSPRGYLQKRFSSVKAIYSSFPASLTYYSPQRKLVLFDHKQDPRRLDDPHERGVMVAGDGLVYPGLDQSVSNGLVMYPSNTFMMQEYCRRYLDAVLDRQEAGENVEMPEIYTIPRGTRVPSHLILINEFLSRFSLQPSHGMSIRELNQHLQEFLEKHATKDSAGDWLKKHPFQSAIADEADALWMAR